MSNQDLKEKWGAGSQNWDNSQKKPQSVSSFKSNPKSEFFEVFEPNSFANTLKLVKRDGHTVYFPYAQQPIIEFNPEKGISIKSMYIDIEITGRGLAQLADWLGASRVKWIKECQSGIDDKKEKIFVMDIEFNERG